VVRRIRVAVPHGNGVVRPYQQDELDPPGYIVVAQEVADLLRQVGSGLPRDLAIGGEHGPDIESQRRLPGRKPGRVHGTDVLRGGDDHEIVSRLWGGRGRIRKFPELVRGSEILVVDEQLGRPPIGEGVREE
jgi:hypothetical protein